MRLELIVVASSSTNLVRAASQDFHVDNACSWSSACGEAVLDMGASDQVHVVFLIIGGSVNVTLHRVRGSAGDGNESNFFAMFYYEIAAIGSLLKAVHS